MMKVSVIVATYNQEKYIGKAIDSILNQKTDFEFEVLVGDDVSKDRTGLIVKEYGERYPDIIKPVIRTRNLGAFPNFKDLFDRAQGEYIALLEGDDYWIDENKLQKQVNFLDAHRDYAAVFGKSIVIDESDNRQENFEKWIPNFEGGEYIAKDYENYLLPGQTATSMYRRSTAQRFFDIAMNDKTITPRVPMIDRFFVLGILSMGKIYTLQDYFAAYRYILNKESGSWSSKNDYYSVRNAVKFLYGLKEIERVGKMLGVNLDFDNRRWYEFEKAADYKGKIPFYGINIIRFFTWLWYKDKIGFHKLFIERHKKQK